MKGFVLFAALGTLACTDPASLSGVDDAGRSDASSAYEGGGAGQDDAPGDDDGGGALDGGGPGTPRGVPFDGGEPWDAPLPPNYIDGDGSCAPKVDGPQTHADCCSGNACNGYCVDRGAQQPLGCDCFGIDGGCWAGTVCCPLDHACRAQCN